MSDPFAPGYAEKLAGFQADDLGDDLHRQP